jgi:hypothetical protein
MSIMVQCWIEQSTSIRETLQSARGTNAPFRTKADHLRLCE